MICTVCHAKGKHRGHRVIDFEEALAQKKSEGEKLRQSLTSLLTDLSKEVQSLSETSSTLRFEWSLTISEIRATADKFRNALKEAEDAASREAERLFEEKDIEINRRFQEIADISINAENTLKAYGNFDTDRPVPEDLNRLEDFLHSERGTISQIRKITETPVECASLRFEKDGSFEVPKCLGTVSLSRYFPRKIDPPSNLRVTTVETNALRMQWDDIAFPGIDVTYAVNMKSAFGELNFEVKTVILYVTSLKTAIEYKVRVKKVLGAVDKGLESGWSEPELCVRTLCGPQISGSPVFSLGGVRDMAVLTLGTWFQNRKSELLYRGSRDGFAASVFHAMCDGMGPTVTLFVSDRGNVFGGFTSKSWSVDGGKVEDREAFLFTLVCGNRLRVERFPVAVARRAVFHSGLCGPSFGKRTEIRVQSNLKRASAFTGLKTYLDSVGFGSIALSGCCCGDNNDTSEGNCNGGIGIVGPNCNGSVGCNSNTNTNGVIEGINTNTNANGVIEGINTNTNTNEVIEGINTNRNTNGATEVANSSCNSGGNVLANFNSTCSTVKGTFCTIPCFRTQKSFKELCSKKGVGKRTPEEKIKYGLKEIEVYKIF